MPVMTPDVSTRDLLDELHLIEKELNRIFPSPYVWSCNTGTGFDAYLVAYDTTEVRKTLIECGYPKGTINAATDIAIGRGVAQSKGAWIRQQ